MHKRRRQLALALSALGAFVLGRACFVEIAEPVDGKDAALGSGGVGGGDTSATGGGGTGGAAATGGVASDAGCPSDQKRCNGACVDINDPAFGCGAATCNPCAVPDGGNFEATCGPTSCVVGCAPGSFDCDNNPDDCELRFGPAPTELAVADGATTPIIPKLTAPLQIDGLVSDVEWPDNVPVVPIVGYCSSCTDRMQPGGRDGPDIVFFKQVPAAADLSAFFRVGWNDSALFVVVLAQDDDLYLPDQDAGATRADELDGIELFTQGAEIDGGSNGLGPTAHHLFIGLNEQVTIPSQSDPPPVSGDVRVGVTAMDHCYVIEASLSWEYLRKFVSASLASGTPIRFDVGVNDWDGNPAQREHQVLWRDPGATYMDEWTGYPRVILE